MLNKRYIEENHVLERYLAEQLTDQEREDFENYYVENPEILRDLEAVADIKRGVALLRRSGELKALTTARPAPRWHVGAALAAALLIAVVAGSYWFRSSDSQPPILAKELSAFGSQATIAAVYQVQRTRSDVDATVPLPQAGQAIKLRLRPSFDMQPASFQVELLAVAATGEARTFAGSVEKLSLDGDGFITVYLDSSHLHPGSYELRIRADAPGPNPTSNDFLIEFTAPMANR